MIACTPPQARVKWRKDQTNTLIEHVVRTGKFTVTDELLRNPLLTHLYVSMAPLVQVLERRTYLKTCLDVASAVPQDSQAGGEQGVLPPTERPAAQVAVGRLEQPG